MRNRSFNLITGALSLSLLLLFALLLWQRVPQVSTTEQATLSISATANIPDIDPSRTSPASEPLAADAAALQPTRIPDRGVRLGRFDPLALSDGAVDYQDLERISVAGNILVARSMSTSQGLGASIIAIDLTSGAIQRISDFGATVFYLHASDQHVVWTEQIPGKSAADPISEELHVYDLNDATETVVAQGYFQHMHYRHGLAVWGGTVDGVRGIYGYNVATDKLSTIEAAANLHIPMFPRACGPEWATYLLQTTFEEPTPATLHAHNLTTGEDIQLGTVILPQAVDPRRSIHDCENNQIVWNGVPDADTKPQQQWKPQISLYDLMTRQQRIFYQPIYYGSSVTINNNIVKIGGGVNSVQYDLVKDVLFETETATLMREFPGTNVEEATTDDLWIRVQEGNDGHPMISVAPIIRDP